LDDALVISGPPARRPALPWAGSGQPLGKPVCARPNWPGIWQPVPFPPNGRTGL